ncbi:M15 family metallopeptidase [Lederbergia graminis]|uniref:D-alanyl-D-alanine carboxypeptidase family protein n=1 Tax=Lederbergia graminis TaxID=735518 RepID=A0ABW0LKZ1_9BACI
MKKSSIFFMLILTLMVGLIVGCSLSINDNNKKEPDDDKKVVTEEPTDNTNPDSENDTTPPVDEEKEDDPVTDPAKEDEKTPEDEEEQQNEDPEEQKPDKKGNADQGNEDAIQVVANPASIEVLVNKQFKLPDNYSPKDLVYPNVRFIFSEKVDKRKMRKEAATALEKMFAGAEVDGILLAGASGYRSQATQTILYNNYVKRDGKEAADRYSARPGHSEHQTGLTMDVSGSDGKCAVQDCFGGTPEAEWIAEHAHEYGFIVRYPKGKEHITGYQYEPWHIRYVGLDIAKEIYEQNITLEEYFDAVPVGAN